MRGECYLSRVLKVATTLGTPSLTALCTGPGRADTRILQQNCHKGLLIIPRNVRGSLNYPKGS